MAKEKIVPETKDTISASKVKKMWDSAQHYKNSLALPTRWETNDKFVAGDQWPPLPSNAHPQLKQMPKPVFNICKQIVNFKSAAVKSENVKMIFSPFGSGGSEGNAFNDDIKDIGELMNRLTEVTWERTKMDFVASRTVDRSAVTGIGITYFYWDQSIKSSVAGASFVGDIQSECLDAMYVGFGNPQELDVQKQPYIIVAGRATVKSAREMARKEGVKPQHIELINSDTYADTKYHGSQTEIDEAEKLTIYTLFWKEGGKVKYAKATDAVLLKQGELKLKKYPFAIFNWEERIDCIYGSDEVSSIIPNQKALNGLLAMELTSKQLMGFPKMLIDTRYVDPRLITNTIGEIVKANKANMPIGYDPIRYIQPTQATQDTRNLVEMIVQKTKDISGANEAVTGEANTNNASAIMLLQKSSGMPTEDIRRRYYQYIEDIGNIFVDFYRGYYEVDRMMQYKKSNGEYGMIEFDGKMLDGFDFTIRSDIGASSVFSDSNSISTLDKMVQLQMIGKVEYLKLLPKSAAPFKEELLAMWKVEAELRQKMQAEQAMAEQAMPQEPSIEQTMVQDIATEEQPPEGQRMRLQEEYGQG